MATSHLQADAVCANPYESGPFHFACEMENHLRIVRDLMTGLNFIADSITDAGGAVATISDLAKEQCEALEALRRELFRATHPDKASFEQKGWP